MCSHSGRSSLGSPHLHPLPLLHQASSVACTQCAVAVAARAVAVAGRRPRVLVLCASFRRLLRGLCSAWVAHCAGGQGWRRYMSACSSIVWCTSGCWCECIARPGDCSPRWNCVCGVTRCNTARLSPDLSSASSQRGKMISGKTRRQEDR